MLETQKAMRHFVRYQNRKIYCKEESRYVTLRELAKLIESRTPFHVLDKATQSDYTAKTVAALLYEKVKHQSVDKIVNMLEKLA